MQQQIIQVKPQEGHQKLFLACPAYEVAFLGEAGGGKTWAVQHDFMHDVKSPNASGVIFRRSYPDLEDLIKKGIDHFKPWGGKWKEGKHIFQFPSGATLKMSHLNSIMDMYDHQGKEYSYAAFEEICQFPKIVYMYIQRSCRSSDPTLNPRIKGTGNPDGPHYLWVKNRFVDSLPKYDIGYFLTDEDGRDIRVDEGTKESMSRCWIPTVRAENRALMDNDPLYEARLNQLPPELKRAHKYGEWVNVDNPEQLIKSDWWEFALSGRVEFKPGINAIGGDYAFTHDRCAVIWGKGNSAQGIKDLPGMKTHEFGKVIYDLQVELGKFNTMNGIDGNGPGVGAFHYLTETDIAPLSISCTYKDQAFDDTWDKWVIKMHFDNWRSQAWWKFKCGMENGEVDLSYLKKFPGLLEKLQREIFAHTSKMPAGYFKVISKEELKKPMILGHSPDLADAVVMWWWVHDMIIPKMKIDRFPGNTDYGGPVTKVQRERNKEYRSSKIVSLQEHYEDGGESSWT